MKGKKRNKYLDALNSKPVLSVKILGDDQSQISIQSNSSIFYHFNISNN